MTSLKEKAHFAPQLSYNTAGGTGAFQAFSAALTQNPAIIIFDNQSTVAVTISDDGVVSGKTFSAGEALVLDLRTNQTKTANDLTWPIGTQFYANSGAGVGSFFISVIYAL